MTNNQENLYKLASILLEYEFDEPHFDDEEDSHESENLLDNYKKFDYVIDNMNMSIQEQSVELSKIMEDIKNKNKIKE